jgi:hypothetical protein
VKDETILLTMQYSKGTRNDCDDCDRWYMCLFYRSRPALGMRVLLDPCDASEINSVRF